MSSISWNCSVNAYLPLISHPWVDSLEFYQKTSLQNGKLLKTPFPEEQVTSPFSYLLKIHHLENRGTVTLRFYAEAKANTPGKDTETPLLVYERSFDFGEVGVYYDHVLFYHDVVGLPPGLYRYVVFLDGRIIYQDRFTIFLKTGR